MLNKILFQDVDKLLHIYSFKPLLYGCSHGAAVLRAAPPSTGTLGLSPTPSRGLVQEALPSFSLPQTPAPPRGPPSSLPQPPAPLQGLPPSTSLSSAPSTSPPPKRKLKSVVGRVLRFRSPLEEEERADRPKTGYPSSSRRPYSGRPSSTPRPLPSRSPLGFLRPAGGSDMDPLALHAISQREDPPPPTPVDGRLPRHEEAGAFG